MELQWSSEILVLPIIRRNAQTAARLLSLLPLLVGLIIGLELHDVEFARPSISYRPAPLWKHPAGVEDVESPIRWIKAQAKGVTSTPAFR